MKKTLFNPETAVRTVKCFVHEDRDALNALTIPCAPGGKIFVCDECKTTEGMKRVFEKYKATHSANIAKQKGKNES